jgi:hypothetical protein
MISIELAVRLRDAGLAWLPAEGDRFNIPYEGLEDHVFSISEMTVGFGEVPGGRQISFNGAVEWALDSIMERDVVWLPAEAQLRDRLGAAFQSLSRHGNRYRCTVRVDDEVRTFEADAPADAYGVALLHLLDKETSSLRSLTGEL